MMKFVRKLLLVLLLCGIVIPAYSAPAKEKKDKLPSSLECPGCDKKVKLDNKKDKKKKKSKKKKDKKKKGKEAKNEKAEKPVKIICPKCKKEIPIPGQEKPAKEDKPEKKTDAPEAPEAPEAQDTPEDQPAEQ